RVEQIVPVPEVREAVLFLPFGQRLQPEAEVQREVAPQADVVLREEREVPHAEVAPRIADGDRVRGGSAGEEVLDAASSVADAERDGAADVVALDAVVERAVHVVARLERVAAAAVRDRSRTLDVVQLTRNRILHRLRAERAEAGHGD